MKRKTNVPIAGDSPGGSARRYVLRALAFLLVLLFASPQAKAWYFTNDYLEELISIDSRYLSSYGYIDIDFYYYKRGSPEEKLYSSYLYINGKAFLHLSANSMPQEAKRGVISASKEEGVVAEVRCISREILQDGSLGGYYTYQDISTDYWSPTYFYTSCNYGDEKYPEVNLSYVKFRVWPKMSDLLNGSITIKANLNYDYVNTSAEPDVEFRYSKTFTFRSQFTSAPQLNWEPSSDPGKFDVTFTPFASGDYYYIDNDARTTTSSTDIVAWQYDISNSVRDVTLTYGCTVSEYQDLSYSTTTSIPAYLLPTSFTATQQEDGNVLLAWEVPYYNGNQYKDDRWVVERDDNPDFTDPTEVCRKVFNVGATSYTHTEGNDLNLNGTYYYRLRRTAIEKWGWASAVTKTAEVDLVMNHRYVANASATMDETGANAVITWDWNGNVWTKNAKLTLIRTNGSNGVAVNIDLPQDAITAQSYSDPLPTTCDVYYYKMYVTPGSSNYRTQDAVEVKSADPLFAVSMGKILTLEASKGYYNDRTVLKWTTDDKPIESFSIRSRVHGSSADFEQIGQLTASAGSTSYTFKDDMGLPGIIYDYSVAAISHCGDLSVTAPADNVVGFRTPTGTINGRVTYGSGQAVKGVEVRAIPEEGSSVGGKAYSFSGTSGSCLSIENGPLLNTATKNLTIQAWVNAKSNGVILADPNFCTLWVSSGRIAFICGRQDIYANETMIIDKGFVHLTAVVRPDSIFLYLNGEKVKEEVCPTWAGTTFKKVEMGRGLRGEIDEVRLWSRALTAQEIANNYNAYLVGNEQGLEAYYTFDFGVENEFYDLSYYGTEYNKRDGKVVGEGIALTSEVPTIEQLCYKNITDDDGAYTIRALPYYSNGTSYTLTPSLGIHSFDPSKELRFVSSDSPNFTVNYTDVSSFPVSGTVYYENTNYPVEGCCFYVDGNICSKDGEMITSAADGTFEISVPIGDHFIEVRKSEPGHTFASSGRYPADPDKVGKKHTFNSKMTELKFYESTLVNFSGRVTGGKIEGDKPLGFGESANTIGQVELQLQASDDRYSLNWKRSKGDDGLDTESSNTERLACQPAASGNSEYAFASEAWRGAKEGEVDNTKTIYIRTDKETGEFSAMLPPLKYKVISAKLVNGGTSVISSGQGMPEYDLTNPSAEQTDSLETNAGMLKYACNAKAMITYHNEPSFTVQDKNAEAGAFGIKERSITDDKGDEWQVSDLYTVGANGAVEYRYGVPLFVMCDPYEFQLKGFEEYVNADNGTKTIVPLEGVEVTINNQLADDQAVFIEGNVAGQVAVASSNVVTLDEKGEATYKWKGGLPNISTGTGGAPDYARTISMTYELDGRTYQWDCSGMYGIILGDLTTGTNFVTAGPDKVDMVLRDPPGTASHAEWVKGTATVKTSTLGGTWNLDEAVSVSTSLGYILQVVTGLGVAKITETKMELNNSLGLHITDQGENSSTTTTTYSAEQAISTSGEPEYVGSQGDVYIGRSTNITYGEARQVGIYRNAATNDFDLGKKDVYTMGVSFGTSFNYSQNYIENVLIPNLEAMLEQKLVTVSESEFDSPTYTNGNDYPIYITKYNKGDANFGKNNLDYYGSDKKSALKAAKAKGKELWEGPYYRMVLPSNPKEKCYTDSVSWIFEQIDSWKQTIANNEKDKVQAYYNSNKECFIRNVSFDSGSKVSYSETNETTHNTTVENNFLTCVTFSSSLGAKVDGVGIVVELETENGGGVHTVESDDNTESVTFMYELAETGDDDALTVDILKSPAGWSPIFHTRAGQTCGPYEGKEETKYYNPGAYVLNEATMQIEKPKIAVEVAELTDVPTGSAANFNILLTNESEIDENVYYKLLVIDESNSLGGALKIDGQPLTEGRRIKIPAGETVKKLLQLTQSNISVLDYENIGIVLASETQYDPTSTWDQIADTVYISAHFVPSSSDVTLHIDRPLLNTAYGAKLELSFDNFDRQFHGLKAFRVQYKHKGEANWTTAQEYVLSEEDLTSNNALLPSGASVPFVYDMSSMTDDEYTFRILSAATYGTSEVTRSSNEITVVRDMARPQLISLPSPADGILNAGDEIALTFNEDIRSGAILKNYLSVKGKLNNAQVSHDGVFQSAGGAGARTSAAVSLDGKPFSVGAWINWTEPGSVFRHGTAQNNFDVSITSDGKLKATIAGSEYVSTKAVPQGKWCYLNVSYDPTDSHLTANVASDAEETELLSLDNVKNYSGNGAVTIGDQISAAIHEVTLWNESRSWTEAKMGMYQTHAASTNGLIGYWHLDEGHGTVGEDKARSRHLALPDGNCWSMENDNYSLSLDGSSYAALDMSQTGTDENQNYMLEFWFRADKQAADATIMHIQKEDPKVDLELVAATDGSLSLNVNGETTIIAADNVTDNAWHHFSLNVLKGISGLATAYVDGAAEAQMSADKLPTIRTDKLVMGAHRSYDPATFAYSYGQHFKGDIDEVRFWNGTQTAALIRDNMYNKVDPETASSLALYYPFEKRTIDSGNQSVIVSDLSDHSATKGFDAVIGGTANLQPTLSSLGLKGAPLMENVPFSFVASDRKLLIELNADQQLIEGCSLEFTVNNVQDMNGNNCKEIKWNAYVSQNQLAWGEGSVDVVKEGTNATSFQAEIINTSGEIANWSLSGMPMWLSASSEAGSLTPMSQKTLTFTVDEATAIGRYEAVIGLSGDNGVASNLIVNLLVTGELPDWTVNPKDFEFSMNMVGRLVIDNAVSEDPDDMVGAFINGKCRGVAKPIYFERYDSYMLMMDIYGNTEEKYEPVTFKAFDASTGNVYPEVLTSEEIEFYTDYVYGELTSPIILTATDNLEQSQDLYAGWNWLSLYVDPADKSVGSVLKSIDGKADVIKDKGAFSSCVFNESQNAWTWSGALAETAVGQLYKLRMKSPATLSIIGQIVDPQAADRALTIYRGTNWIGYNANYYLSPNEAFAGLNPVDGDVVKSQQGFSIYAGYEWVGTLKALEPGKGYIYKSNATAEKTFNYPKSSASRLKAPMMAEEESQEHKYESCSIHKYEGNMNIIAQAWKDDQPIECEIAVFDSNGECRGSNLSMYDNNLVFLTIQGEGEGEPLTIRVVYTERGQACDELIDQVIYFSNDALIGDMSKPMFIDLGGNSDSVRDAYIDAEETQYYNLRGIRVDESYEGFRISKGNKTLNK